MNSTSAKAIALAAVRRRFDTAVDSLEEHMRENMRFYGELESDQECERAAEDWLEANGFGPETIRYRDVHAVFEEPGPPP
jgi:hypothetical protein